MPGVRENGGQYTHAAAWAAIAFAALGEGDKTAQLLAMLNPISHGATPSAVRQYKVEPYAVAADVYSESPHTGRGGWTWYTGSAGWLIAPDRVLLGLPKKGERLELDPCIRGLAGFSIGSGIAQRATRSSSRTRRGVPGSGAARARGAAQSDRAGIALPTIKNHRVRLCSGSGLRVSPIVSWQSLASYQSHLAMPNVSSLHPRMEYDLGV